jgi:hypothetical protein
MKKLGVRATNYVREHSITAIGGRTQLVPDTEDTPAGVRRTLTRVLGAPRTLDRGETEYWLIDPALMREVCS